MQKKQICKVFILKTKDFLLNTAKGAAIGTAMIIPGVSGGTLAVIMKIYDKLIDSISNLKKDFKGSTTFLFPILLGAVLAFGAAYFPLTYALNNALFPTIMLFCGLMAGSSPKMIKDANEYGFKKTNLIAFVIPFIFVIGICFLPVTGGNVDLGENMQWYIYFALIVIGMLGSCALVVPGISGSMLLLLLGYYEPILATIKGIFVSPVHSIIVLGLFGIGVLIGFFTIAKLMQFLLNKFKSGTRWAIAGFAIGSIPAIVVVNFPDFTFSVAQTVIGIALFIIATLASFFFAKYAEKHS